MGRYRCAISYESDTQPVETVRGEFEAPRFTTALYRGGKVARDNWPRKRRFRSVVTVIEALDDAGDPLTDDDVAVTASILKDFAYDEVETKWVPVQQMWLARLAGGFNPDGTTMVNDAKLREVYSILHEDMPAAQLVVWARFRSEVRVICEIPCEEKDYRSTDYRCHRCVKRNDFGRLETAAS